jgi:hypothetical protein
MRMAAQSRIRRVRSADSLSGIRLKLWSETPSGNCRFTARLSATSQHHHSGPAGLDSVDLVTSDRKPASSQRRFAIQVPELPRICPRLPGSENDQAKSPSGLSLPSRNSRPVHGDVEAREQVRSGRVDSSASASSASPPAAATRATPTYCCWRRRSLLRPGSEHAHRRWCAGEIVVP